MKVNYNNENYKAELFLIYFYIILMFFITLFLVYYSRNHLDIGFILFCNMWNLFLGVLLFFTLRRYSLKKEWRNKNVFIIKKGNHFKGKIVSIYDNNIVIQKRVLHNVTAEIVYTRNGEDKKIIVDQLCINRKHLEK